jgi:hypothetical protein
MLMEHMRHHRHQFLFIGGSVRVERMKLFGAGAWVRWLYDVVSRFQEWNKVEWDGRTPF